MTSTSTAAFTHTVEVGKADYSITPDVIRAEVGDFIRYEFYPKNHSIVRADYEYPCVPYELVNTRPGFYSGFRPVDNVLDDPPSFTVRVNDTDPIFVYCSGPFACDDHAMVAVVNPNANTSLDQHKQWALEVDYVLQPGDDWPAEGEGRPVSSVFSTSTRGPTTVTISPTSVSSATAPEPPATSTAAATSVSTSSSLSGGAIAGIAIGAAAVLLLAAIAIWMCGRRSNRDRHNDSSGSWRLGCKKDPFNTGANTPATILPAYDNHGIPTMAQTKSYPNVTEQYIPVTASPPPSLSPYHAQQNFPPHIIDPAAFQHPGFVGQNMPGTQVYASSQQYTMPNQSSPQPLRSEIYSGTPAPQPAPSTGHMLSSSGVPSTIAAFERQSFSLIGGSRGGSPDPTAEMTAA